MDDLSEFFHDALGSSVGTEGGKEFKSGSIRLKSAIKQWKDYMKNRSLKRDYEYLASEYEFSILQDSVSFLPLFWKICLQEKIDSHFINWSESSFPTLTPEYMEVFQIEMSILIGRHTGEEVYGLQDVKERLKSVVPNLISMACFLVFNVSLDSFMQNDSIEASWPINVIKEVVWSKYYQGLSIGLFNSLCLIRIKSDLYLIHRDHLLNLADKISERMNILIFSLLSPAYAMQVHVPTSLFLWIFSWGDAVINKYGSEGFLLISNYEALIVGLILRKGDELLWDNHRFLNSVCHDVFEELEGSETHINELLEHLYSCSPDQLCDLHGLYRIWGHPEVRLKEGLEKMMTNSLFKKSVHKDLLDKSVLMFREIFCRNYYQIHKHYPDITISPGVQSSQSYIINQLEDQRHIDINSARYAMEDWRHVTFNKNFQVPATWNLAHNIKDKAISPDRDELYSSINRGQGVIIQEFRRTVLKWLKKNMVPMREFLENIDVNGLEQNSLIIGLYAKERELKLLPRFFSLMSFDLRLYFVSTEQLLSDNVLRYFPQITMTVNLLEMTKKILNLSGQLNQRQELKEGSHLKNRRSVSYAINIDFKKWNQQMRKDITDGVFKELDSLFGFQDCYTRTHKFLGDSLIYLCSGEHTPQVSGTYLIEERPWNWSGDESGKEGLRQKGWTIMTVSMIEYVMRSHDVTYELIGGGDNQVLVVTLQTELTDQVGVILEEGKEEIRERMERILTSLDNYFTAVGLPLKLNETWVSSDLFMYNKIMCYRGRTLRNVSKAVSRTFPFSDDAAITISGMSSAVGTILKSIPTRDLGHLQTYKFSRWLAQWTAFVIFYAHPLLDGGCSHVEGATYRYSIQGQSVRDTCPSDAVMIYNVMNALLFHHRILGGPSLGVPADWVMRGFPDPLTSALAWNMQILRRARIKGKLHRYISSTISLAVKSGPKNFLHLISDPVSINHDAPISGLAALREISEKAIVNSDQITNSSFKELASVCHSEESKRLIESLTSSPVLEPRFLHDIFGATLYGYFNSIVSRVDKSMTIIRLNRKSKVMADIKDKEITYLAYLMDRWRRDFDHVPSAFMCSRDLAEQFRWISWGRPVVGVTVPSPVECFRLFDTDTHNCDENFILVNQIEHDVWDREIGPLEPYLGSYTDEKFKLSPIAGAFGEEELLTKVIHLQKLRHWRYQPSDDLYHVIRDVLVSETDMDPDSLFVFLESGSSSTHRYADSVLSHGAILNSIPDLYRWYSLSSTTLSKRSKGGRNDMIHFQATFLWITSMLVNRNVSKNTIHLSMHFHEMCDHCIVEVPIIDASKITLSQKWEIPRMRQNNIAYIRSDQVRPSYSNIILISRFEKAQCCNIDVQETERGDHALDCIAQGLFRAATGGSSYSQSNINSMMNINRLDEVLSRLKSLVDDYQSYSQRVVNLGKLSAVIPSQPFLEIMRSTRVGLQDIVLNKSHAEGGRRIISAILTQLNPSPCKFMTDISMDPHFFLYHLTRGHDKSINNCYGCQESLLNILSTCVPIQQMVYGCVVHVRKPLLQLRLSVADPYSMSKMMRPTFAFGSVSDNIERIDTSMMWNSILSSTENDPAWRVPPISSVSEYISTKELYSLFLALIETIRILGERGTVDVVTDGNWNYAILGIIAAKSCGVACQVSTFLSPSSNTGSEFCGMIGLKSMVREEDRKYIRLEQHDDTKIIENSVQIVTGYSGRIIDSMAYIFPLSSNRSAARLKLHIRNHGYILWYPRVAVDHAVWCIALRSEVRRDSFYSLFNKRLSLKQRPLDKGLRRRIDVMIECYRYPLILTQGIIDILPELSEFVEPKHKLDMITNAQILIRKLNYSPTRKSIRLEGKDLLYSYLFLSLLSLSMGDVGGRILSRRVHSVSYYSDTGRLHLKRKRSDNNFFLSLLEAVSQQFLIPRIHYDITGRNDIYLLQSKLKGVHIYNIL